MKNTLLGIALAAASLPLPFAAQTPAQTTPANPPASGAAATTKVKKHKKVVKQAPKKDSTAAAPAAKVSK